MKKKIKKKSYTQGMNKQQVERLSKSSARKIIQSTDNLRSWGKHGYYKSLRLNKYFYFRSSIEANVLKTLDQAEDLVEDFATEQFMIEYQFKNATLNYVPDFILKTKSGNRYVIEVKPVSQLQEEKNVAKWNTAKPWCWSRGVRFFVITDKDWPNLIEILNKFEDKDISQAQALMEWKL